MNREDHEDYPRNNQAANTNVPRNQEDSITQLSAEIDIRVTKKLSHEFNRTENAFWVPCPR